ncbi:early endosome antigen 1-like [Biomphalaria glabrata]|uniref:Early endosome antigen 1-like n=1 Tax=Biomphalaria glabrata TaxID=6526 RepID=A0A9W2YH53_BIOGL|nr:early endosome antigen 1-like [Biomphalaria glabrata]XP_055862054.1 early endosome antigen 1-like [Biomphalaria glabrata]
MEIYTDKENESVDFHQTVKQVASTVPASFPRTPLLDVKNKSSRVSLVPRNSNENCEALTYLTTSTPGRKQNQTYKRRVRSCISAFQFPVSSENDTFPVKDLSIMPEEELEDVINLGSTHSPKKSAKVTDPAVQKETEVSDQTGDFSPFRVWNINTVKLEVSDFATEQTSDGSQLNCEELQAVQLDVSSRLDSAELCTQDIDACHAEISDHTYSSKEVSHAQASLCEHYCQLAFTEPVSVPLDLQIHIEIPNDDIHFSEQSLSPQPVQHCLCVTPEQVNSPVLNESLTSLDMNKVEAELMELMLDASHALSENLSDSAVNDLLGIGSSPQAGRNSNLHNSANDSHSSPESNETVDILSNISVRFTPARSEWHCNEMAMSTPSGGTDESERELASFFAKSWSSTKSNSLNFLPTNSDVAETSWEKAIDDSLDLIGKNNFYATSRGNIPCFNMLDSSPHDGAFWNTQYEIPNPLNSLTETVCSSKDTNLSLQQNKGGQEEIMCTLFGLDNLQQKSHEVFQPISEDMPKYSGESSVTQIMIHPVTEQTTNSIALTQDPSNVTELSLVEHSLATGNLETVDVSSLSDGAGVTNQSVMAVPAVTNKSMITDPYAATEKLETADVTILSDNASVTNQSVMAVPAVTNTSMITDPCAATEKLETADVSILTDDNVVINQSIMAVPTLASTSMITDSCHALDISQNTECVSTLDHSIMAVPDILNKQTMTEKNSTKDAESTMTPFKPTKLGKRLTTEDVRRQHPRTIANQLEATNAANQRLEKEVIASLKERDNLKVALKEAQMKLTTTEKTLETEKVSQEKHIRMLEELHEEALQSLQQCLHEKQSNIYNLEHDLNLLQQKCQVAKESLKSVEAEARLKLEQLENAQRKAEMDFNDQLEKLKTHYNESNYKRQFQASLQAMEEIKIERDELLGLTSDLQDSFLLQVQFKETLDKLSSKVLSSTKLRIKEHACLVTELKETKRKYSEVDKENKKLHFELANMDSLLNRNHNCLAEMETLYCKEQEALKESRKLNDQYTDELSIAMEALEDATHAKESLTQQLLKLETQEKMANHLLDAREKRIKELEQELMETKQLLDVTTQSKSKKEEEFATVKSKLERYIADLQHTLDKWEVEREVLEQELYECRETMFTDKMKLEDITKEVEVLRQIKDTSKGDKEMISEMKTNIRLLEEEKQLCMEAITEYRNKLEDEVELNSSNQQLIEALRRNNEKLQESYNQLMSEMQHVEATLAVRNSDFQSSSSTLLAVENRMNSLVFELQQKLGQEVNCDSVQQRTLALSPRRSFQSHGDSFVALVLAHASQATPAFTSDNLNRSSDISSSHHKRRQTNVPNSVLHPDIGNGSFSDSHKNVLDMSGLELFSPNSKSPVKSSAKKSLKDVSMTPADSGCVLVPGFANIRSIPSTSVRVLESNSANNTYSSLSASSRLQPNSTSSEYQPLLMKAQIVERLFDQIVKSFTMVAKASELTIEDLRFDMEMLSKKLKSVSGRESKLESDLSKKNHMLDIANEKIKDLSAQILGMNENLHKFQDQTYEISRLEEDKAELKHKVQDLKGQVSLLTDQLTEAIKKLSCGSRKDGDAAQEILLLKKTNHELMMKLFNERDRHQELGEKAMKRIKILESNWKKAENEVERFDDLVEQIRQACVDSHCQSTVPVVLHIVRLIDGKVDCLQPRKESGGS